MAKLSREEQSWYLREITEYLPLDENESVPLDQRIDRMIQSRYLDGGKKPETTACQQDSLT